MSKLISEELTGKIVGIYGCGRTGRALVRFLQPLVAKLYIFEDASPEKFAGERARLSERTEWKFSPRKLPRELDWLILSPGVPINHPPVQAARQRGTLILGEVELAARLARGKIWAVTGTNGKSSSVELLGCLLQALGKSPVVCGNRGKPFIQAVFENLGKTAEYVVEISSFQIETMRHFRPDYSLLTNLQDDHQDRHSSLEQYHALKLELIERTRPGGRAVLPAAVNVPTGLEKAVELVRFTDCKVGLGDAQLCWTAAGLELRGELFATEDFPYLVRAFPQNLLAVIGLAQPPLDRPLLQRTVELFQPPPHRAEQIETPGGIQVINDSKGTTPSAVAALVKTLKGPFSLLLGGGDKQADFGGLFEILSKRRDRLTLLSFCGEARLVERLVGLAEKQDLNWCRFSTWESAVKSAVEAASPGETVLLSPGGTSFDAFENYRERGELFKKWTKEVLAGD